MMILRSVAAFAVRAQSADRRVAARFRRRRQDRSRPIPWTSTTACARQNPLGKIPVLIAEDGTAYYNSRVILDYLDDRAGGGKIVPRERTAAARGACACRRCATAFSMRRS